MNNESFRAQIADYILSGHAYLHYPTTEKTRFLGELKALAESLPDDGRQVFVWSHATGWHDADGNLAKSASGTEFGPPDPQAVPQQILDLSKNAIFALMNFGFYVRHKTYSYADVVIAWLCKIRDVLAATGRTVVFLGPDFDVPPALANDVTTVELWKDSDQPHGGRRTGRAADPIRRWQHDEQMGRRESDAQVCEYWAWLTRFCMRRRMSA